MRRFLAGVIDVISGLGLAYLLHWHIGNYFASRGVVALQIGSPDTFWKGGIPWLIGIFGTFIYTIPFGLALIFLPELWGWSIGKKIMGIKIISDQGEKGLVARFLIKTAGLWGMTLSFIFGSMVLLVASFFLMIAVVMASLFRLLDYWGGTKVVSE